MILCFFEWVARVFPPFYKAPEVSGYKRPVSQNPAPPMCDHYLPKLLAAIRSVEKEELWLREASAESRCTSANTSGETPCIWGKETPPFPGESKSMFRTCRPGGTSLRQVAAGDGSPPPQDRFRMPPGKGRIRKTRCTGSITWWSIPAITWDRSSDRARHLAGRSFGFAQEGPNERQLRERIQSALDPSLRDS